MTLEILGTAEIGEWLSVKRQEVAQWKFQGKLPEPDYNLRATPVWKRETLMNWKEQNSWVNKRIGSGV
jgi:hypothetical protein|tara:strand:- start:546 stop:749 length:204 start_codon:yes stop_codon:yes gene_type:complete